jgi:hypothetical protein
MAGLTQKPTRQVCTEQERDENYEPYGPECGTVHYSTIETCPEHSRKLTAAFWAAWNADPPHLRKAEPAKKRRRPGKRSRGTKPR